MIYRQMKIYRSQNIDDQTEISELTEFIKISSSPEYNTKLSILCEFKETENGCIGYIPIHSSIFLIQSDPENNKLSLSIVFQKQQTYTEIREYVEEIISKKPLISQLVDNKEVIERLKAKMQDYKGLDIDRIKLALKTNALDEKTFLKEFTRLSCDFSANVVKELTQFKADIIRRKEVIKELNIMSNVNLEEAKGLIKVINDKKQQFKEIYDKVNLKNSEINEKVERIRNLLKDQLPKIVNMPLSRVEEESFKQIIGIEKQVNITKAKVDSEIKRFKSNREYEETIFRDHKLSFSKEVLEESIKPSIKKLNEISEYLENVKAKLKNETE